MTTARPMEYRLIRPDGKLLWITYAADYDTYPVPPVRRADLDQAHRRLFAGLLTAEPCLPPWIYRRREPAGEWVEITRSQP